MRIPSIKLVEWIEGNEVRLFFSSGKVVEVKLPVEDASTAHVVDEGCGLDPGDGLEMSSRQLVEMKGKVFSSGKPGWLGYKKTKRAR